MSYFTILYLDLWLISLPRKALPGYELCLNCAVPGTLVKVKPPLDIHLYTFLEYISYSLTS